MKKYIHIIYALCFISNGVQAQVLWSEDFDNYTLGSLGVINKTNSTSAIFAQDNWQLAST